MNDIARAKEILAQARDALVERIAHRIVEAQEEILDDATGQSYMSEIEGIYEQLGGRLNHVNAMLANLPAEQKTPAASGPEGPMETPVMETPVMETPVMETPVMETQGQEVTFETFVQKIRADDLEAAGAALAELFQVDTDQGQRCAQIFSDQLQQQPEFLVKAMNLRNHLATGNHNDSLMLIWECFGLQGLEAVKVMQLLQARMAAI